MRRLTLAWVLALCALTPQLALAKPVRVMVLDIPPDEAFKPNVLKAINEFLAGAVRDQGFEVVSSQDIAAALGVERQRQLMGCSESNCMAEIGGALGASYLIHGTLAVLENDTALTLSVVDNKGKALNQVRKLVKGKSAEILIPAIEEMVPKLMRPVRPESGPPAQASAAAGPAGSKPPAGGLTSSQQASAGGGSKVLPYSLAGLGAVALVGSGLFGYLARSSQTQYDDAVRTGGDTAGPASATQRNAWLSTGLLAGGVVALGAGVALLFLGGSSEPEPAQAGK